MKYQVYCFFDKQAGLFMAPMIDINEATAKRNFAMQVNKSSGSMNFSPSDYDLYRMGTFTDNTGVIECESPFEFICNGSSVVGE